MLGHYAGEKSVFAILGLVITGIIVPFSGMMTMILFDGNYREFFFRLGKIPGSLLIFFIMALIGPFAGIPRCITLSYSTLSFSGLSLPLWLFSLIACGVIFLTTFRKNYIVAILGNILTPLLLVSLAIIIVQGLLSPQEPTLTDHAHLSMFIHGLKEGYNTLDLPAAFFFSMVVLTKIKTQQNSFQSYTTKKRAFATLKACAIGATLLACCSFSQFGISRSRT
jgi:LIVCS family branched-chain amino acid:cation transporter